MPLRCKLLSGILWLVLHQATIAVGSSGSEIVPPIFRYDDFKACRQVNSPGEFCYVRIVLESKENAVDSSSRIVPNFRRNLLDWGMCIADCQREVGLLDESERERLFQPKIDVNFTYMVSMAVTHEQLHNYQSKYGKLINICVNNRMERDYQLSQHAYAEIEHCVTNDPLVTRSDFDWLTVTFIAIGVTLIGSAVGASAVDLLGGAKVKDHLVVSAFSIRHNWARLTEVNESKIYKDIGYIDGIRVFINIYVLLVHCILVVGAVPTSDPSIAEGLLQYRVIQNITATAYQTVQFFIVITGILLMANFMKDLEDKPQLSFEYFWKKIINRWFRLCPVYYYFLLMSMVGHALPGVELGPLGYKAVVMERNICRERGWKNILFVSNLTNGFVPCFLQGWYLGADQQMFLGAILVLTVIWKYPKSIKPMLVVLLVIPNVIATVITYKLGLESVIPIRLSELKFLLSFEKWFFHIYQPSYVTAHSIIAGMIAGYLYHETKRGRLNLDESKLYAVLRKVTVPITVIGFLSPCLFYEFDFPRPSWTVLLHSILYRNYGAFAACMCFIHFFRSEPGTIRRFLASRPMASLGKLSYSVYVLHVPLLRLMVNNMPTLMEATVTSVGALMLRLVVLSYALGLVVYLVLEQPTFQLLKHYILDRSSNKVKKAE
nr:regulator of hypoxia-inducible factor 1-like [Aedes albopictus]